MAMHSFILVQGQGSQVEQPSHISFTYTLQVYDIWRNIVLYRHIEKVWTWSSASHIQLQCMKYEQGTRGREWAFLSVAAGTYE
jgi:hypothetical protein